MTRPATESLRAELSGYASRPPETRSGPRAATVTRPPTSTQVRPGPLSRPALSRPTPPSARSDRPSATTWKPAVPSTIAGFTLEAEAELGAHGLTFSGHEVSSSRPVNVLVFHPAFFFGAKRLENLARLDRASRYAHPGISPVLGAGEIGPTRWVATLPVGGLPLTHWRREKGNIPVAHTYRVMAQLLDALEAIHRAGGVHGGLSPETIRFHSDADRVLLAQPWWLDAADVPLDELKPLRTAWLAPELVFGEPAEAAADVYGAGLVLGYVLACGLTEPGHSLLVQGIDVPPSIDDIYVVATSRQPEHRFPDVASLRVALALAAGIEWREAQAHVALLARASVGPSTRRSLKVEVLEVEQFDAAEAQKSLDAKGSQRLTPELLMAPSLPPKDIESTSEDIAFPAMELPKKAFRPSTDEGNDRTDTAMPAFHLDDDDVVSTAVLTLPADERHITTPENIGPVTGRSQRRVVAQTLPHGHNRPGSALIPVLDPPDRQPIGSTSVIDVDLGSPPPVVPTIAPRAEPVTVPDTLIRVASRLQSPPPRTSAVPDAASVSPTSGTPPPSGTSAAVTTPPVLPPAATGARPRPIVGPPSAMPSLPGAKATPSNFDPFSSSLEVLELGPAHPPSLPAMSRPPALPPEADEPVDSGELDIAGESTIVEGIAPALLDSMELGALAPTKRADAAPDPFAEPVVHLEADSVFAVPGATMRPPPPPTGLLPEDQEDALATLISSRVPSRETVRPPRTESLPSGPLMPVLAANPPAPAHDPRTLRDASSALAGAQRVTSSGPNKGPIARASASSLSLGSATDIPLHGGDHSRLPLAQEKTNWTLWAALAALVIGGVIAFFVLSSGGDEPRDPGQVAVTPGETGGTTANAMPDASSGNSKANAILASSGGDVAAAAGEPDAVVPDAGPGLDVPAEASAVAAADAESPEVVAGVMSAQDVTQVDGMDPVAALDVVPGPTDATAAASIADVTPDTATAAAAATASPEVTNPTERLPEIVADPNKLRCPDGMLKLKRKIQVDGPNATKLDSWEVACIDRFEFPGAGASPAVGLDLPAARAACINRGKRLCTRSEWRRACGGTYPYGKEYDPERCNTAGTDGAPKSLVAAGSKKGCMSPSGAFDMVGNAAEWTSDGFINGGSSLRNSDDATCGQGSRRAGGAPHVGFRCCADAK